MPFRPSVVLVLCAAATAAAATPPPPRPEPPASPVQAEPQVTPRQRQLEQPDRVPVDVTAVAADLATTLRVPRERLPDVVVLPPGVAAGACGVAPSRLSTGARRTGDPRAPVCAAKQVTRGLADAVQGAMASDRPRDAAR